MYQKRLYPFILELITFLLIAIGISFFLIISGSIIINWSTPLCLLIVLILLWLMQYVFSFVPFALLVTMDAILKNYDTISGRFIEQFIFKSSSFLDKNAKSQHGADIKKAENLFYKVAVKTKHGIHIFTSAEYFPLEKNIKYSFVVGRKSKVIVDVSATPPPNTQTINPSSTTNPSSTIS